MNVCIIGAGGLIGKSLIERLLQFDGLTITGFSRAPEPHNMSIRWIQGDLQQPDDCARAVEGQDIIYHLAHTNSPLTSDQDISQDTLLNLVPTLELLKAIEKAKRTPHFIYPSSGGAIYGVSKNGEIFNEDDPCLPLNSYGIQKLVIEHYIRLAAHRQILTSTVFRISNAYGWLLPPNRPQGFIGTAITRVLIGQPVRLVGNVENVRDYIHFDDIIDGLQIPLTHRRDFEIYNIGSGVGTSVIGVVTLIEKILGTSIVRVVENIETARYLPNWCVLNTQKAYNNFGWSSKISLEEGITRMLKLRVNRWEDDST